ncbi:MAG: polysaccharide lyase 8 family protein [Thermoguttaceae bacterium]
MPSHARAIFFVVAIQVAVFARGAVSSADDLETIRLRMMAPLLTAPDSKAVARRMESMKDDGTWPDIDYTDAGRSGWSVPAHLERVETLARAYRAPASPLGGDAGVLAAARKGLDAWLRLDPQNPNWWWNEIGVPGAMLPVLLLLDDELSATERQAGLKILERAKIGMTGQNLVWVSEITAGRGLLERDSELVGKAYRRITDEIRVSLSEGIQPDCSFHQHGPCLYSHGYGAAFLMDCSQVAVLLEGTALALPREKIQLLARVILDGTQWMTRGVASDFGAEGREITRRGQSAAYLATVAERMLRLETGREEEFRALAARIAGRAEAPPLVGNRHFWRADLMTHQRPKYYASARMHSTRLANTDGPSNSEGLLSHHLADGCFVLMQTGKEFNDLFGVWDWRKIPGTTVRQKAELTGTPRRMGTTDFVGGVSDGTYGLSACDLERDGLAARKSWFFFDDEIVCLGAGITATEGEPVVTTINQCALAGDVVLAGGDGEVRLERGDHTAETPKWFWHDSVGYVLVEPARLRLQNDARSGSWHASNGNYPQRQETRDLLTAWIEHGTAPEGARYGYVVVPGTDREKAAAYAADVPVRVLANDENVQAVVHERLGVAAAAFYRPGKLEIGPGRGIEVDRACLMLLRKREGGLELAVANPRNEGGEVRVRILAGGAEPTETTVQLPEGMQAGSSVVRKIAITPAAGATSGDGPAHTPTRGGRVLPLVEYPTKVE